MHIGDKVTSKLYDGGSVIIGTVLFKCKSEQILAFLVKSFGFW